MTKSAREAINPFTEILLTASEEGNDVLIRVENAEKLALSLDEWGKDVDEEFAKYKQDREHRYSWRRFFWLLYVDASLVLIGWVIGHYG